MFFPGIMEVPLGALQSQGVQCVAYLDDWILWGDSKVHCQENILRTTQMLQNLGFIINTNKSQLIPSQTIEFLGVQWNTR